MSIKRIITQIYKKRVYLLGILLGVLCLGAISFSSARAPSFQDNFANYMTDATPDQYGRVETVFSLCIDRNLTLMENVKNIFYPNALMHWSCSTSSGGQLRDLLRIIMVGVIFVFIVVAGIGMIMDAKGDGPKKWFSSLIYIGYGAFLVFGVTRILGVVFNIGELTWSADLVNKVQNNLFLQILSFFKVLAFFIAIIMMVVAGFRMMAGMDQDEKLKSAKKSLINIIIALVLIKIIDYVYYIAQVPEFPEKVRSLVVDIAKILGYVLGASFLVGIFYAGFLLFTSGGDEEAMKKTKSMLINIFVISLVVFIFLLLIYQIFNEFVK